MPQFDPAVWSPQLVWLAISFVLLYVLMARVALPKVAEVLEEREFRINESLRKAEAMKQQAEDAVAAYEKMMADARTKAQEQIRTVRERAAEEAAERNAELSERLTTLIGESEARIARARDDALTNVRAIAVEVAEAVVGRLIGKVDARSVTGAVDRVIGGKS
ncbi:MAG: F0F1 ATP synthase subunit B' [Rhodospirillales bacterium]